ncbi:MAG: NADP-dependent oxidoreductase, partial [Actinomycetota bacterium]|nr:NADP-dependent oxidoreductase [Actinomycetota bacterium]
MRAAVIREFGEPSVVETTEVEDPLVGPDYVLIEVAVAGVNPVDWKIVAGYLQGAFPHHLPLIPGWDVAGEVVAVGPAVTEVAPGDRVAAYARKDHVQNGTFAELVAVSVRSVAKLPDGVDIVEAGALPLAGLTATQLMDAAEVAAGDTVLVHAAGGGVGSFAVQLAVLRGARVIGTGSVSSHDHVRGLGAEPVEYGDGLVDRVRDLAPTGVDVVIDLVGGDALAATPRLLSADGRVAS